LTEKEADSAGVDRFFDLDSTIENSSQERFVACIALGYPARDRSGQRNTGVLRTAETVFTTGFVDERGYRLAKADPRLHVLISYRKENILYNWKTRGAPPSFLGMSGGGVWLVSLSPDWTSQSPPPLAGIIIKKPHGYGKSLLAVRSAVAREFIRRFDR
jgi:hypothetical protein